MPLHNMICLRQSDAAATFLSGEVQFKNLILDIGRNSATFDLESR